MMRPQEHDNINHPIEGTGPILVTGTPYSGTTWLGQVLSSIARLPYVHEPFNISAPMFGYGIDFGRQYTYLTDENESEHLEALQRLQALRPEVRWSGAFTDLRRFRCEFSEWRRRWRDRRVGGRSVWKDPMAVLSAGWIADRFDASVIVIVRHPAAFASAAMSRTGGRVGTTGVGAIRAQPVFMSRYGLCYQSILDDLESARLPAHAEKASMWRMLLEVLLQETSGLDDRVRIVRYEDVCEHAHVVLPALMADLGLVAHRDVDEILCRSSESHAHRNRTEFDLSAAIHGWQVRFSAAEIDEIVEAAGPLEPALYGDRTMEDADSWAGRSIDIGELRTRLCHAERGGRNQQSRSS